MTDDEDYWCTRATDAEAERDRLAAVVDATRELDAVVDAARAYVELMRPTPTPHKLGCYGPAPIAVTEHDAALTRLTRLVQVVDRLDLGADAEDATDGREDGNVSDPDPRFLGGEEAVLTDVSTMAWVVTAGWDRAVDIQAQVDKATMAAQMRYIADQIDPPADVDGDMSGGQGEADG